MQWKVSPTNSLKGVVQVPPSKSQTLRAILFASLADGVSTIENVLESTDSQAMLNACTLLGAKIEVSGKNVSIVGNGGKILPLEDVIDVGNSGIALRFLSSIAALSTSPIVLTGDFSIQHQRPMNHLLQALTTLGVSATSTKNNGYAPLIIQGPVKSTKTKIHGADSQPVSSLLILGAFLGKPLEIEVSDPGETPWVQLTLDWMDFLQVPYQAEKYHYYNIGGGSTVKAFKYFVPGDMSSAAFSVAAAVITGSSLIIKGLNFQDRQGDRRYFDILKEMGAQLVMKEDENAIEVLPGSVLKGITVDINDSIDAICILAVTACYAEGETRIHNASVARSKECNRIAALVQELSKMGAGIQETEDGLLIRGSSLKGTSVRSHHDHRMAMSLAVAGLGAKGETVVQEVECAKKTYPGFFDDFRAIGAQLDE